ncbi:uncharacterized protein LOC131617283 [Vicia villosa]|uniref:uncharacterized protein LOC131617283 n=1 Tax=Vicia villosa TaxID=3911 RepID=UPI00273C06C1|nr:uncharacterized protein LOC131617283 [Vicia villosa]
MERTQPNRSSAAVRTRPSRDEQGSVGIQKNPKRTRSYVLKQMLEEIRRVKKESSDAMEEIEARTVKTEPVNEEEEVCPMATDVMGCKETGGGSKGKGSQQTGDIAAGHRTKSYHAAVYRASFQSSLSPRQRRNTGTGEHNGRAVEAGMSGVAGSLGPQIKREACTIETAGIAQGGSQENAGHISTSKQRNARAERLSKKLKGKAKVVGNSVAKSAKSQGDNGKGEPSHRRAYRPKSVRISTPAPAVVNEQRWTRVVDNPVKLRNNVLHIPRAVIYECIRGQIPRITLIDVNNNVPYYCEMIKREDTVDRYLCGAWSDFCKDRNLQKGDTLRFCIRYPPVESIMVFVERGRAE